MNDQEQQDSEQSAKQQAFERYLKALRGRVGDAKYKSWFLDLNIADLNDEAVTLSTGSEEKRDMLDHRFLPILVDTWRKEIGPVGKIRLTVKKKLSRHAESVERLETFARSDTRHAAQDANIFRTGISSQVGSKAPAKNEFSDIATPLDPLRTFDAFAVGDSNRMAWAASRQTLVSDASRELVYLYGPSGFGKTHLLQAICHQWRKDPSRGQSSYITYSNFTNTCVNAVMSKATRAFHKSLLENDLIAVDDIHFLAGKERTQEELLILIDAALDRGKQVVLAGGVAPAKLADADINQRLADRLAGGLCAPIHQPDHALRLEILNKRVRRSSAKCLITDEVLDFIAKSFAHSTRETIGALKQVLLMYRNESVTVYLDDAKHILRSRLEDRRKKTATMDDAIVAGADAFSLSVEEILGRAQPQRIARGRHAVVFCAREVLKESFPRIGKALKRDHTTVMSSYRRAQALIERDKAFQTGVQRIRDALEN
ncbi:MAG: DnaA/Hda family protein [Pseudomonadota bacterium]